ncbi:MAG: dephospho-CoA kinase [Pseudomonadota bacterium]
MKLLGLTGSIGMGKSTAAAMFRAAGVPVFDADAAVHRLIGPGGAALEAIGQAFPDMVGGNGVDREKLGAHVFGDAAAKARLEAILHPMVEGARRRWLARQRRQRAPLVVLDIPLLYETGGAARCDAVAVVSASSRLQRARVLARPGMTEAKFAAILAAQLPDADKRRRADYVIRSGLGRRVAREDVRRIIHSMTYGK